MMLPLVRDERSDDAAAVRSLLQQAFHNHPHSNGREYALVDALRANAALDVALVAEIEGAIVAHCAFSKVTISGDFGGWYGLGPVAVLPAYQGQGIGSRLIREGLNRLKSEGAAGCVVLGEPEYYERFGFRSYPELELPGVPAAYFMALAFAGPVAQGIVAYRPEFEAVS